MALRDEEITAGDYDAPDADGLYRQGMLYYRARQWQRARDSFAQLHQLDPERRGIDSLISELDHFIRLEAVRPGISAPAQAEIMPTVTGAPPVERRSWLAMVPILALVVIVATAAFAGTRILAQEAIPSPSAIAQTAGLLQAQAMLGDMQIQPAGTGDWVSWSGGRLLRVGDHIHSATPGRVELTLADGPVVLDFAQGTNVDVTSLSPDGMAFMRQTSGHVTVHAQSSLFHLESPDQVEAVVSPLPTVLPGPAATAPPPPTATPAPAAPPPTAAATVTTAPATATPSLVASPTIAPPTSTPSATPSLPPATATPPPPPTSTPRAQTAAPTATPVPPTITPAPPTSTPVPQPTPTRKR